MIRFVAIVTIVVLAPTAVSATRSVPPINCEHSLDCLLNAAKTCTQARMIPVRPGFSRAEQIEIQGEKDNKCLYFASRSAIKQRGFACQFYSPDGLVSWLEMMSRRRRVIYDSRKDTSGVGDGTVGQRTIETIDGKDVAECMWL